MPQRKIRSVIATPPEEPLPILNAGEGNLIEKDHADSSLDPRQARWNFGVILLDVSFFAMGMSFLDMNAVLPLLMEKLGASGLLIGIFAALRFLAFSAVQVFVAYATHDLPHQKPPLAWVAAVTRLPLLVLPYFLWHAHDSPAHRVTAMWVTIILLSFWALGDGLGYVPWMEIVARAFSDRTRGRFFATTQIASGLSGVIIAGFIVRNVLKSPQLPYPTNYAVLAALSALMFQISLIGILLIREPPIPRRLRVRKGKREEGREGESPAPNTQHLTPERSALSAQNSEQDTLPSSLFPLPSERVSARPTLAAYLRRMPALVRANPEFARLAAIQLLIGFGAAASPFYVLYAKQRFQLGDEWGGTYQVLLAISVIVLSPFWAWLSEKRGPAAGVQGVALACLLTPLSALTIGTISPWTFGLAFLLMGGSLGWGMWIVVNHYLLTHIAEEERPLFVAMLNLLFAPSALYPVLGGMFMQGKQFLTVAGVPVLFALTGVVIAVGCALTLRLPNPASNQTREVEPV